MTYVRTPEHRHAQAIAIHIWKPWTRSTGPKTLEGKQRSARRGYKGAVRPMLRSLTQTLRAQRKLLQLD